MKNGIREKSSWLIILLKPILQGKVYFIVFSVILFAGPLVWFLYTNWTSLQARSYDTLMQFAMGFWSSIGASLLLVWGVYLYQSWVRDKFWARESIVIRVPLMLGSAPLFISKKFGFFDERKINVDLDFRYAGIDTLGDLKKGKCNFAVASEIAIATFLSGQNNLRFKIYSLPFVRITGHIKILVKGGSGIADIQELNNKKVAYIKDSVHGHFLDKIVKEKLSITCEGIPQETIMQCFTEVSNGTAQACIFWEPHYLSMKNNFGLQELNIPHSYEWFLCLVTTQDYYFEKTKLHKDIFAALKKAVNKCESDLSEVARGCSDYMLQEFTGVSEDDLVQLLDTKIKTHVYKIDDTVKNAYEDKLTCLHSEKYYNGACQSLLNSLWPNY